MIILLLLRLFCATDHLSFLCLMTLAHIVCWSRCNTDIQMTLSDNDTHRKEPFGMEKTLNIRILLLSRLAQLVPCLPKQIGVSLWIATQFYVHIYPLPQGRVLKVFITNLPSTCWLPRISGQFCDGSFSKSVINTKTALTRLSIQNNILFLSARTKSSLKLGLLTGVMRLHELSKIALLLLPVITSSPGWLQPPHHPSPYLQHFLTATNQLPIPCKYR